MPSKNVIKIDTDDIFYHVYNRGVNKQKIFTDETDYRVFFSLFKRYLSEEIQLDQSKREYPNYSKDIELLAICLMPNHFHLLFYQKNSGTMTKLLRSVCTAYTMYYNKQHKRVGHLFQERYRASRITSDAYLFHISRYIHLNPEDEQWQYSSLPYYCGKQRAGWINPARILQMFDGIEEYERFLADYKDYRKSLELIEQESELL